MSNILDIQNRRNLEKEISGALMSAIKAHGPIIKENRPSATKRIYGALKNMAKRQQSKKREKAFSLLTDSRLQLNDDLYAFLCDNGTLILSGGTGDTPEERHANYREILRISPRAVMFFTQYLNSNGNDTHAEEE